MRMHVFDMDGTLMEGTACLEISKAVGALEETLVIEADWVGGKINDVGFWNLCLPLWEGITSAQIDQAFSDSPWLRGVSKVLGDIKQRDEISVVISQSPEWFVERICRWGLDHAFGAGVTPGDQTGSARLVTSADKVSITNRLLSSTGISEANCIAYGDSSSDLELFKHLDNTVAINAKPHIRTLASAAYDGDDLFAAYKLGRELMDAAAVN